VGGEQIQREILFAVRALKHILFILNYLGYVEGKPCQIVKTDKGRGILREEFDRFFKLEKQTPSALR
tara:strand:+ start:607 stop:807 length:201 start_codon:yes stop_codon:yes gene_type:complete